MKTFKLSQSKDDNLLKITSKKTNYEIKLTDNELLELRTELGFNFEPKEIETEKQIDWRNLSFDDWMRETKKLNLSYDDLLNHINGIETCDFEIHYSIIKGKVLKEKTQWVYNQLNPIDWQNLSFPEWFYQTSKLEFTCYEDLREHYFSDETNMDNANKIRLFIGKVNPIINSTNTERLYEILTNPTILKVGDVVKIGEYECIVKQNEYNNNFYLKIKEYGNIKVFSQFGLSNEYVKDKFNSETTTIFPETKTLKELTKIYYYLKTFEV